MRPHPAIACPESILRTERKFSENQLLTPCEIETRPEAVAERSFRRFSRVPGRFGDECGEGLWSGPQRSDTEQNRSATRVVTLQL